MYFTTSSSGVMRMLFLPLLLLPGLLLLDTPVLAQDRPTQPSVSYGRTTLNSQNIPKEEDWLDLFGVQANELSALVSEPVYGASLRIEVWEPGDKEKPRWSKRFCTGASFREKTPLNCTFKVYFAPPRLKNVINPKSYPAWLVWHVQRPGEWAEENPTGWVGKDQIALPENYLGIEGYELSQSAGLYEVGQQKFDRPLPFFHYYVSKGGYGIAIRPTFEETRQANPDCVHIIAWLEPILEPNDFFTRRSAKPAAAAAPATPLHPAETGLPLLAAGTIAPSWQMDRIGGGGKFSSEDLRGKISVLNFWATWCGHCIVEMPGFIDLQEKYRADGVQFVGFNTDRQLSVSGIERFLKWHFIEKPVNYPILLAPESVEKQFGGIDGLPTTYLVDETGKIVLGSKGEIPKAELEKQIKELLARKK